MRLRHVGIIFRKELTDVLRDRRLLGVVKLALDQAGLVVFYQGDAVLRRDIAVIDPHHA